jgi:hypothetical protein
MAVLGHMLLVSLTHVYSFPLVISAHQRSEVAFVGKAPGTYLMLLGGGYYGQRLNKIYRGLSRLRYNLRSLL